MKQTLATLAGLAVLGCACFIPDWNTRSKGMGKEYPPHFSVWTVPRWQGEPGEVTVFARVNHSDWRGAELIIARDTLVKRLDPEPDLSWVFRERLPKGRHVYELWVQLEGETQAYRRLIVDLKEQPGGKKGRKPWEPK